MYGTTISQSYRDMGFLCPSNNPVVGYLCPIYYPVIGFLCPNNHPDVGYLSPVYVPNMGFFVSVIPRNGVFVPAFTLTWDFTSQYLP